MLIILNRQTIVIYKIKQTSSTKDNYSTDEKKLKVNSNLDTRFAHKGP